ncbi:hypothetical protein RclHR1_00020013 [Rhizophagus clarus]|uniref:Uncharacterized protein n=1 Tax=Rhizophagus clarus TaxID=94130 RepID=A0A2Z6QQE8_9GLOM|nr:hypothetical protein RclHR1_17750003 [Rhizophagus clarus]GBB92310.1 hypothetical protein RclHR1_00020013 [Rhizophagus clarus]GET03945.1 hypothetical protein GLOIN_2v1734606 [Rhizophagus clarus]
MENKISDRNVRIIVEKNNESKCSGEKRIDARNDVCHIIRLWYDLLKEDYNRGLPERKKCWSIGWLHEQIDINREVRKRVSIKVRDYGMLINDVLSLFTYKVARNCDTHKDSLNRRRTAFTSELSRQLQDALNLLHIAPHQPLNFASAFEKCARRVYRRRN